MRVLKLADEIKPTAIQSLNHVSFAEKGIALAIKREDMCHPIISGNKWHKLHLNLALARHLKKRSVLSFGGAWSNHIHALAYACALEGFAFKACIRGDELAEKALNPMLLDAKHWGAELRFLSRGDYSLKKHSKGIKNPKGAATDLNEPYVIPEGGANDLGVLGSQMFAQHCIDQYQQDFGHYPSHLALSSGTGTMAAGFYRACADLFRRSRQFIRLRIYPAVQACSAETMIKQLATIRFEQFDNPVTDYAALSLSSAELLAYGQYSDHRDTMYKLELIASPHRLSFGKQDKALHDFIEHCENAFDIPIEPVYQSKLLDTLFDDIHRAIFPAGSRLLLIHSGGLQGRRSLKDA